MNHQIKKVDDIIEGAKSVFQKYGIRKAIGLDVHEVFPVHAEGRDRGDAQMMGLQPILIDGRFDRVQVPPGEQLLPRNPFGRDYRMQRKRRPTDVDLELFFQPLNTPGNEVAPGSDEIRKDLAGYGALLVFPSHASFMIRAWPERNALVEVQLNALQFFGNPNLDQRLPRYSQPFSFLVQPADHP